MLLIVLVVAEHLLQLSHLGSSSGILDVNEDSVLLGGPDHGSQKVEICLIIPEIVAALVEFCMV